MITKIETLIKDMKEMKDKLEYLVEDLEDCISIAEEVEDSANKEDL